MSTESYEIPLSYYIEMAAMNFYLITSTVIFLLNRNRPSVKKRLPSFNIVCSLCMALVSNCYLAAITDGIYYNTPKELYLWQYYLLIPLFLYCSLLRDIYIIFLHHLNVNRLERDSKSINSHLELSSFDTLVLQICIQLQILLGKKRTSTNMLKSIKSTHEERTTTSSTRTMEDSEPKSRGVRNDLSSFSSFSDKDMIKLTGYIVICEAIIAALINIISSEFKHVEPKKRFPPFDSDSVWFPIYGFIGIFVILKSLFVFSYRRLSEPYGLKIESTLTFLLFFALFLPYMLRRPSVINPTSPNSRLLYLLALALALHFLQTLFPILWDIILTRSLKSVKNNQENFMDVLQNQESVKLLKQVMVDTFCVENIIFHQEFLKAGLENDSNPESVKRKLEQFRSKFIAANSPYELNILDSSRKTFIEAYKDSNKGVSALKVIHEEVLGLIYSNSFPHYLRKVK